MQTTKMSLWTRTVATHPGSCICPRGGAAVCADFRGSAQRLWELYVGHIRLRAIRFRLDMLVFILDWEFLVRIMSTTLSWLFSEYKVRKLYFQSVRYLNLPNWRKVLIFFRQAPPTFANGEWLAWVQCSQELKECFTELQVSTTHPFRVFTWKNIKFVRGFN